MDMTYEQIIRSSVHAEFDAYCERRPYSRLPKGHPVYLYGMIDASPLADCWRDSVVMIRKAVQSC
jgi:hypothetical protein